MPLDAICLEALARELRPALEGAKIDKVQQPERDMLLLSLRGAQGNQRLLIAAGTGNARVHLTRASFENPAEPPMFCMLLRKHLLGARILSLIQPERERMLILELDSRDELGDPARKRLVVEMIGRSSNVILVGPDGRILDCMRRVDFAGDALRRLLPGMLYRLPPRQDKAAFLDTPSAERRAMAEAADRTVPADKWLLDRFAGLSPLLCRELSFRCGGDYELLPLQMDALEETVRAGDFSPTLLLRDGKPLDFSFLPIRQYGEAVQTETAASFSELLDAFHTRRDKAEQQRRRGHELTRTVKTARDRLARKLAGQREELKRTEGREEIRKQAELITANLYRLKKGARSLVCEDYYTEGGPELTIPLDPLKTPQQNAAALYKEYNKLKAAEQHLTVLIAEGERQLDYLESVLDELGRAESEKDLADLRRELGETGWLRAQRTGRPERAKAQAPLRFLSDEGFEILVGRSNLQNDELTIRLARRTDYWLHTQKLHGSHVIVRCDGLEPPETTLRQAASLAAYYSQGRGAGKVPVDCTMVRFVRKPAGALPGKVLYTDYRTLFAESDEALVERLKQ